MDPKLTAELISAERYALSEPEFEREVDDEDLSHDREVMAEYLVEEEGLERMRNYAQ